MKCSAPGMDEMSRKAVGNMTEMMGGAVVKIMHHCKEMEGTESESRSGFFKLAAVVGSIAYHFLLDMYHLYHFFSKQFLKQFVRN